MLILGLALFLGVHSVRIVAVASHRNRPSRTASSSGRAPVSAKTSQSRTTWVSATSHGLALPQGELHAVFTRVACCRASQGIY